MTARQQVLWTLLPNGMKDQQTLKATVTVSPHLMLDAGPYDLSQFSNWQHWPETILHTNFSVIIDGGAPVPATRVAYRGTIEPDPATWAALFPSTTPVAPYNFDDIDLSKKTILTNPLIDVVKLVSIIYGGLASTAGLTLPVLATDLHPLMDAATAIRRLDNLDTNGLLRMARDLSQPGATRGIPDLGQMATQMMAFHRPLQAEGTVTRPKPKTPDAGRRLAQRPGQPLPPLDFNEAATWRTHALAKLPKADQLRQDMEFHRIVTALAQYSELLRLTGLVVDLEFPRAAMPDGNHTIQLGVDWPRVGATDPDSRPRAWAAMHADYFGMAPNNNAPSEVVGRYLQLSGINGVPTNYSLFDLDADGAGIKLKNFVGSLRDLSTNESSYDDNLPGFPKTPRTVGAPSLRSAGLTLAHGQRATAAAALFSRAAQLHQLSQNSQLESSQDGILYAEDVVRGYRADIYDVAKGSWYSLHRRDGDYAFPNTGGGHSASDEEGMIRLSAASSTDGSHPEVIKMHQAVLTWRGWSLSAPEPSWALKAKIVETSDPNKPENAVDDGQGDVPAGMPLKARFSPHPQTLPTLRFGRQYAMRLRLVDLAGESEPFSGNDSQPQEAKSAVVTFHRYEPIESPNLALVGDGGNIELPAEGESMGRLAIRTRNADPTQPPPPAEGTGMASRYLVAPRVSHRFAEMHGVLDASGVPNKDIYTQLKSLDQALDNTTIQSPATPPSTGIVSTTYAVADAGKGLSYIPDPWSIGVAFWVFGTEGQISNVPIGAPFYSGLTSFASPEWPKAQIIRITLVEGTGKPKYDKPSHTLVVPLAKGEKVLVRVSSIIPSDPALMGNEQAGVSADALSSMAVWQMFMNITTDANARTTYRRMATLGQHWMITPWRTLELIHATQKPLVVPAMNDIRIERKRGWTYAIPHYRTPLSSKSTAKIDLLGAWFEPSDVGDGPKVLSHTAHAYEIKLARLDAVNGIFTVGDPDAAPDSWQPPAPVWAPPPPKPTNAVRHVFSDTRYRRVKYTIDATTRYREYMPQAIADSVDGTDIKVSSPAVTAWIPNAASPPAPKILYVIPTFGWGRNQSGDNARSLRLGGGLRVYLERPWFDSGFTEMLGVVLPSDPNSMTDPQVQAQLKTYVTQWGADPAWLGGTVATASPPPNAFPLAKWRAPLSFDGVDFPSDEATDLPTDDFPVTGLRTPEMIENVGNLFGPGPLAVAPHAVGYDSDRQLWYADIVVRPGASYFPFIRLGLARYNPISALGCHLSSVVMAEFMQLTPDRLAVVTRKGNTAHVAVYGFAPTVARDPANAPRPALFQVVSEILDAGADPDIGWRLSSAKGAQGFANPQPTSGSQTPPPPTIFKAAPPIGSKPPTTPAPTPGTFAGGTTAEIEHLLSIGDYATLVARPDLMKAATPPLLWEGDADIPNAPNGGQVRLVITESEVFPSDVPLLEGQPIGARVVYAETVSVAPGATVIPSPFPPPAQGTPPPIVTPPVITPPIVTPPTTTPPPPPPPPRPFPLPTACTFAGEWTATKGTDAPYILVLQQEGNTVTGTYAPAPPANTTPNDKTIFRRELLQRLGSAGAAGTIAQGTQTTQGTSKLNVFRPPATTTQPPPPSGGTTPPATGAFSGIIGGTITNGFLVFTWTEFRYSRAGWTQTGSGRGTIQLALDCNSFLTPPRLAAGATPWNGTRDLDQNQ